MASGTITLTASGKLPSYLNGRIVWSSASNGTAANTSTVTAQLQISRNSSVATSGTWYGSLNVGGTTKQINYYASVGSSWVTIDNLTVTVTHNADGSGSCYIYGILNGPTQTTLEGTYVSGSATVTMDKIARYASIVSAPDFYDDENPTITYSNPAGNSVTTLEACISLDGSRADIAYRSISKTGTSYTFSLTEAERNVLRTATTGSNSRTVRFFVRSTIGSGTHSPALSRTFTIRNPNPTISPAITDSNDITYGLTNDRSKLVRYYSNAAVTIGAAAVKQASLVSQTVTCGNKSLTASGTINAVESDTFVFTATDSRGNTTTQTVTMPFVEYIKLTCDMSNNMPDTSGNMAVRVSGNYFNGSFGSRGNSLKVYYRYKSIIGTFSNWTTMEVTLSGNTYSATAHVTGLDYQTSYVFEAYAVDALATVHSASKTVKATPVFDWSENDFQFHVPVYDQSGALIGNSADEWQNPPMLLGVEYRTTERYLGKPVYTQLVNFGQLVNNASLDIPVSIANLDRMCSLTAEWSGNTLPINTANDNQLWIQWRTTKIVIRCVGGWGGGVGYARLKYTKTTD